MLDTIIRSVRLVQSDARYKLLLLPLIIFISSSLDALGIAAVFPFIKVLIDPQSAASLPFLPEALAWLGVGVNENVIVPMALTLIAFFLGKNIFLIYADYWRNGFSNTCQVELTTQLLRGYIRSPFVFHLKRNRSELLRNINNSVPIVFKTVFLSFIEICIEVLTALAIFVTLLAVNPDITIAIGVLVSGLFLLFTLVLPKIMRHFGIQANIFSEAIVRTVLQALGAVKEIRVLGRERELEREFESIASKYGRVKTVTQTLHEMPRHLTEVVLISALVGAVFMISDSGEPASDLIATLGMIGAAAFRMVPSVNRTISAVNNINYGRAAVENIFEHFMEFRGEDIRIHGDGSPPLPFNAAITLSNVGFAYPDVETSSLSSIFLSVEKGQSVGIVGRSGAGKTTLVNILLGLLEPSTGSLKIDDTLITPENVRRWQKNIGFVSQDIFLTDDTLRRNIALGVADQDISEAQIDHAVATAQLREFVDSLNDGVETIVGENGVRLSGGQRQRIGVARALYHHPDVLIFDEATSALDSETEAKITETLDMLRGKKTLIIIAHRMTTVQNCDFLVFMENGVIVETGSYYQLIESNDSFRQMVSGGSLD